MGDFFRLFFNFIEDLLDQLATVRLQFDSISVSLSSLLFAFMVLGLVITVFWRGAKT